MFNVFILGVNVFTPMTETILQSLVTTQKS